MPMAVFAGEFLRERGHSGKDWTALPIAGDGSTRQFWRIYASGPEATYVAMQNVPVNEYAERENLAYLKIGSHLRGKGVPLPEIYRFDAAGGWFILEDLGDRSLQEDYRESGSLVRHEAALEVLLRLQTDGARGFDRGWTCQTERYDQSVMRRYESEYFREAFLCKYLGLKTEWPELKSPFDFLAEKSSRAPNGFLLHRDFQSRNIMVGEKGIGILDWQGARLGPLAYDVASLVIDPYVDLLPRDRARLVEGYAGLLAGCDPARVASFQESFPYLALQRNLQILGAFAFLSKVRGKRYFEAYIPKALRSLHGLLREAGRAELAPLLELVEDLLPKCVPEQAA
ncbi:MAG: phosphotransferase [Thermodesulfobacteriota bacterium]